MRPTGVRPLRLTPIAVLAALPALAACGAQTADDPSPTAASVHSTPTTSPSTPSTGQASVPGTRRGSVRLTGTVARGEAGCVELEDGDGESWGLTSTDPAVTRQLAGLATGARVVVQGRVAPRDVMRPQGSALCGNRTISVTALPSA